MKKEKSVLKIDMRNIDEIRDINGNLLYKSNREDELSQMVSDTHKWLGYWKNVFGLQDWNIEVETDENSGCRCTMQSSHDHKCGTITIIKDINEEDVVSFLLNIAEPELRKLYNDYKLVDMFMRVKRGLRG